MAKSREENMLDRAADSLIKASIEEKEITKKEVDKEKEKEEKVERVGEKEATSSQKKEEEEEVFAHLVKKYENPAPIREGDIINAKVVQTTKEGVLLDVGMKSEGFMPWEEYASSSDRIPQIGEKMNVYVVRKSEIGHLLLSKKEADFRLDWAKFTEAFEKEKPIKVKVIKAVKGGLLATIGYLSCFIPASHVSLKRKVDLRKYIGKTLEVRVIELDKKSKNIVVSRKFFELDEKEKRKERILLSLEEGKIVTGKVSSITKFGVFVDLGGIDGLIHPENLSWGWVKDPKEVVNLGQEIQVKVLKLDKDKGKISLGLKQTIPDPWSIVEEKYKVGSEVTGKVTHLTNFGAFVEIEKGLEGLIHISDLSWDKRISHPKEVVYVGQEVNVKILDINPKDKRMALGLKQTQPDPWQMLAEKYKVGDIISGKVQEITNFGVFVNLLPGIDGLIHISELDSEYVHHPERVTSVGEEIRAEIVEIDPEKRRIRLSVKRLKEKVKKEREKEEKEKQTSASSQDDEGIVIGDFIREDVRKKLKQEFFK
ncbi:30S ribosomal protein S1 [Candidatus Aerophobetes bacterium]|uniref:30S ribosomal protein S1 n=1 Tax=Aerophobetes bacterium TaxID=2030807 RepID=A0A662DCZ0_UNCAE|nr:MAG: 30S ribosomal protein S1 [Candidatus Aerophobetes bacterium]